MEEYLIANLIEEIKATSLYNDEGKEAMIKFVLEFNHPENDADFTELLHTLKDLRLKEETIDAQAYSMIRGEIEPLIIKLKEHTDLTEEETKILISDLTNIKNTYKKALIKEL